MNRVVILLLALLLMTACSSSRRRSQKTHKEPKAFHCLMPDSLKLLPGDVVFRRGGGLTSHVVVNADREGQYSHVGIAVDSAGQILIVHAVPGEHDFKDDVDRVKANTPQQFFSTEYTSIGEVLRPADSIVARKAAQVAWRVYQRHTLFDHDYDDSDTTRMYCTELVAFAYQQAGHDIAEGRKHSVNLPVLQGDCLFPSDIYASDYLTTVIHF